MKKITPDKSWEVFNQISSRYDKTNRILSLGIDKLWRKKVVSFISKEKEISILDLATGTGDLLKTILDKRPNVKSAVALDLAQKMLLLAEKKMLKEDYFSRVSFKVGSALALPSPNNTFDYVTIAYGIRNTGDVEKTLEEMQRVLKPNGEAIILEFSLPTNFFLRAMYLFYFRYILPLLGGLVTGNFSAYFYLNKSVEKFPSVKKIVSLMGQAKFHQIKAYPISWGICTLYVGKK